MRNHGCNPPLNSLQVMGWCLTFIFLAIFYVWYIPVLPFVAQVVLGIVMGIDALISITTCLITTLTDAADPSLKVGHDPENIKLPPGQHVIDENFYCAICEVVVGSKSKHCSVCNKCVGGFDHHCKWLNNCIGKKNYRPFLIYLTSIFLAACIHGSVGLAIIIQYFVKDTLILNKLYEGLGRIAYITVTVFFTLLTIPALYLIGQLFLFHIRLRKLVASFLFTAQGMKGLSTYEFIIQQRQKEKQINFLKETEKSSPKEAFKPKTNVENPTSEVVATTKKALPPLSNKPPNVSKTDDIIKEFKKVEEHEPDPNLNTVNHSS